MKQPVSLIALDMDGTLFNGQSEISKEDQDAIREASSRGIHVAISTGRPYAGLPVTLLSGLGVSYAITSNGAAVYHLPDRLCIHESAMEPALVCPIIEELQKKSIHMDAFINGDGFSQRSCEGKIDCLDMPTSIKRYIHRTRTFTDDLAAYIRVHNLNVQKMTLNFYPQEDGTFLYRDEVMQILSEHPEITFLSGGYHNLEFTRAGVTKGNGLTLLCSHLGVDIEETLACGDTQNDIDILKTAAIGVAMENALPEVKEIADFVMRSNENSGVAHAIHTFAL